MANPKSSGKFRFKKHDYVGANDAEDDDKFLNECFQDTGDVEVLMDCSNPKKIILGRTGAGKSAALLEIGKRSEFVVPISPEQLCLNFLTNSTILPYLTDLGVNLDPFFKLLWRHVFAITIIQNRVDIVDENKQQTFIQQIKSLFESRDAKDKKKHDSKRREKALAYLESWGDRFFEDVEIRTKEVVQRFEEEIKKSLETKYGGEIGGPLLDILTGKAEASRGSSSAETSKNSGELKQEIVERAKIVVNEIQVKQLDGILDLLNNILDDRQKPFFIVIDKLDEAWAEESLRLRLLKGLLDAVKEFGRVKHAKIVIALRVDLLEQLFKLNRTETGFQEDKYRSLNLYLNWSDDQLVRLLNKRVEKLVVDAYTNYRPTLKDILPDTIKFGRKKEVKTIEYVLERTWGRPRDAIEFLNACIAKCEGKPSISKDAILTAEGEYSRGRLRAISTEWFGHFPNLADAVKALLTNCPKQFKFASVAKEKIDTWALRLAASESDDGELKQLASRYQNDEIGELDFRREIASIFYKTGVLGIKPTAHMQTKWANSESYSISKAEIGNDSSVSIHPGLWKVLGIDSVNN